MDNKTDCFSKRRYVKSFPDIDKNCRRFNCDILTQKKVISRKGKNKFITVTKHGRYIEINCTRKEMSLIKCKNNQKKVYNTYFVNHVKLKKTTDDQCYALESFSGHQFTIFFPSKQIAENCQLELKKSQIVLPIPHKSELNVNVIDLTREKPPIDKKAYLLDCSIDGASLKCLIKKDFDIDLMTSVAILKVKKLEYPIVDDCSLLSIYHHIMESENRDSCSDNCWLPCGAVKECLDVLLYDKVYSPTKKPYESFKYKLTEKIINQSLPKWLMRLLSDIYFDGPKMYGIFREKNRTKDLSVEKYCAKMLFYNDFEIPDKLSEKVSLLKHFLMKIQGLLISDDNRDAFTDLIVNAKSADDFLGNSPKGQVLFNLILSIPRQHLLLLQHLLVVLSAIAINHSENKMHAENISRVLTPTIFRGIDDIVLAKFPSARHLLHAAIIESNKVVNSEQWKTIADDFQYLRTEKLSAMVKNQVTVDYEHGVGAALDSSSCPSSNAISLKCNDDGDNESHDSESCYLLQSGDEEPDENLPETGYVVFKNEDAAGKDNHYFPTCGSNTVENEGHRLFPVVSLSNANTTPNSCKENESLMLIHTSTPKDRQKVLNGNSDKINQIMLPSAKSFFDDSDIHLSTCLNRLPIKSFRDDSQLNLSSSSRTIASPTQRHSSFPKLSYNSPLRAGVVRRMRSKRRVEESCVHSSGDCEAKRKVSKLVKLFEQKIQQCNDNNNNKANV